MANEFVIRAEGLTRYFGQFLAVDHVSFTVEPGEVVGYLGPNGCGKTTTIRMLLGLLLPSEGHAHVLGFDAARESEKVRQHTGYMSQKFSLYQELTVEENLRFYAGVYGIRDMARLEEVIGLVGLQGQEKKITATLSVGWRQRLALAAAIVHRPRLLLLDEPTSGVDPSARRAFWDLIYHFVESGVSALVTTHYMDEAEYCSRVGIMRDGRLLALDSPSTLRQKALPGLAWDVSPQKNTAQGRDTEEVLRLLNILHHCPCVIRAGLVEDHLRAITPADVTPQVFLESLRALGIENVHIESTEPSLEDVFLALAARL